MLWKKLPFEQRKEYEKLLALLGALSGMFKDIESGTAAKKPYLYYRLHEQLFCSIFDVDDLTRQDSSFDAIALLGEEKEYRVGVGLKTFNVSDLRPSIQKIAEFNRDSVKLFDVDRNDPVAMSEAIAELRNLRLSKDIDVYATERSIYHTLLKDDNKMIVSEFAYDAIQMDSIKGQKIERNSVQFTDGLHQYSFNLSKSTLMMKFSPLEVDKLSVIPVNFIENPFDWLANVSLPFTRDAVKPVKDELVLPLYGSGAGGVPYVPQKAQLNAFNGAPKIRGSDRPRPAYEAYIAVPRWVHGLRPDFFGIGAERLRGKSIQQQIKLIMPSGQKIDARITQDDGKSLQTNPQSVLGKWLLHDIYRLGPYEVLTRKRQIEIGVDSVVLTKEAEDGTYSISLGPLGEHERWKVQHEDEIESLARSGQINRIPTICKDAVNSPVNEIE